MKRILIIGLLVMMAAWMWAEKAAPETTKETSPIKYRLDKKDTFVVVGLEVEDFMVNNNLMEVWQKFLEIEESIPNTISKDQFGVSFASGEFDPETMKGYNYIVGREVSNTDKIPDGMQAHKVKAASYVVFDHHGSVDAIPKTYDYIYGTWMRGNKYKPAETDTFELYGERFDNPDDPVVEIWVPIAE